MHRYVLNNATLWIGDGEAYQGHIVIGGDKIESLGPGPYLGGEEIPVEDLRGAAISPGMIDLMMLGGFGFSILRDDPCELTRRYLKLGVTSVQFCTGTMPWDSIARLGENVRRGMSYTRPDAARVLGIYWEGPFQDPNLTGASLRDHALPPTVDNVARLLELVGDVTTMINISPGVEGDAEAVRLLCQAGKVVSMAHSNAPGERVLQCVDAGTSVLGHVFDNNSGRIGDSGVQQPTIEHVAFIDDRVKFIHLICDGVHVHPLMIKLVLRCRGLESLCIVTDGNQRMGAPDGPFVWDDGQEMYKAGGVCRTKGRNGLAGSATLLPDMLRHFVKFTGIAPEKAIRTVTLNPAANMGVDDWLGRLAPGFSADLVAWSDDLRVRRVWRAGQEVDEVSSQAEVTL